MKTLIQKIRETLRDIVRQEQGMSLIELIVAMSIMVIMLGVTTIYLPNYRANQILKQAGLDINDSLRYTQTLSQTLRGDDTNYYVWELDAENPQVLIKDENGEELKVITYDDDNNQLISVDTAMGVDDFNDKLYFEAKTGKISIEPTFAAPADGEIGVIHDQMNEEGRLYYSIEIFNNSFNLDSKKFGGEQN